MSPAPPDFHYVYVLKSEKNNGSGPQKFKVKNYPALAGLGGAG